MRVVYKTFDSEAERKVFMSSHQSLQNSAEEPSKFQMSLVGSLERGKT